MSSTSGKATIRTVCGLNDYLRCGLSVEVNNGVITKVRAGDFPDPADKGACAKGLASYQLVYHPDRLRYPLKRVGERGAGQWQRVSWNQAMDGIASRLRELGKKYGPTSIAWLTPELPNLAAGGYSRLISLSGGTWVDFWGCGDAAGPCADIATFGLLGGDACLHRIDNPRFILVWGYNPALTVHPFMQKIMAARKKGAKVVVIDPRLTDTAAHFDEHVPIRPGTDGALALGMINVILERKLQNEPFIAQQTVGPLLVRSDNSLFLTEKDVMAGGSPHTFMVLDASTEEPRPYDAVGVTAKLAGLYTVSGITCRPAFQLLSDMVRRYTPQAVSEITDVPADVIRRLAHSYSSQGPAAIYRGWGMQRSFYSDLSCRAVNTLAAITGNISLKRPSSFVLNTRSFLLPGGAHHNIPVLSLHDAATKGKPYPIKALWSAFHNFINQMPNTNRVVKELLPHLELIIVCDLLMTVSARYADYVLPASSFYESTDVCMGGVHNTYLQLQEKAIEPLYESKPDFRIVAELAGRLGFGEYFNKTEEQYIEEILASGHESTRGVSVQKLREGPVMAEKSKRPLKWRTPTGRIEFYVERLKDLGQELPVYLEPLESVRSPKAKEYPLSMLSTHAANRVHSNMSTVPGLLRSDPEPTLEINPADAARRQLADGDTVRIFNDRGQVKLKARLSTGIKAGVVNIAQGWWPEQYIAGHHNELTHDAINPAQERIMQANAAFFDVLVEVEKA